MPLADIEKSFMQSLLNPGVTDDNFLSLLSPVNTLSKEKQLFIYKSNVNGAHQKVLGQVYPACLSILGEDYFNQLCRVYRFEYPSTNADLNCYGEFFPVFINEQVNERQELNDFEYLSELASLEWHWHKNFYTKDNPQFDFESLTTVKPEYYGRLVFVLSDSFYLHATLYPLLEIWQANKDDQAQMQKFNMFDSMVYFCMFRDGCVQEINEVSYYEYQLLSLIISGASLNQLSDIKSKENENLQNLLTRFIEKKWITDFIIQDQ